MPERSPCRFCKIPFTHRGMRRHENNCKMRKQNALKSLEKMEVTKRVFPPCIHINRKQCHSQYDYCPDCGKYISLEAE